MICQVAGFVALPGGYLNIVGFILVAAFGWDKY
jgi:hypothetical protein